MWQLRGREVSATHRPDEVRPSAEDAALLAALDLQHANGPTQFLTDHPHRLKQIGIVGDHHSHIEGSAEGIEQEMGRKVDVRPFLLRNPDLGSVRSASRRADEPLPLGVLDAVKRCTSSMSLRGSAFSQKRTRSSHLWSARAPRRKAA
jgi:hypothetical protein